jgi:hypothetical protein
MQASQSYMDQQKNAMHFGTEFLEQFDLNTQRKGPSIYGYLPDPSFFGAVYGSTDGARHTPLIDRHNHAG